MMPDSSILFWDMKFICDSRMHCYPTTGLAWIAVMFVDCIVVGVVLLRFVTDIDEHICTWGVVGKAGSCRIAIQCQAVVFVKDIVGACL